MAHVIKSTAIHCRSKVYLICIKLHVNNGHTPIHPDIMLRNFVDGFGYILQDKVEVQLIFNSSGKETMLQLNDVRMVEHAHNLEFSVLISLILQHLLYCYSFICFQTLSL